MAGQALGRGEPLSTCNQKNDSSGGVRPGARPVEAQARVVMPVRDGSRTLKGGCRERFFFKHSDICGSVLEYSTGV